MINAQPPEGVPRQYVELRRGADGRHHLVAIGWRESPETWRRWVTIQIAILERLGCALADSTQRVVVLAPVLDTEDWTPRDIARIEGVLRGFRLTLERIDVPADEGRCARCSGEGETRASYLDEWLRCGACRGSGRASR